jgi:hypothetical protein
MASLSRALARVQQDCQQSLPDRSILAACKTAGYKWRERKLGPVATVHLFILQVVLGDRGFCSYVHLAMLCARDVQACFRMHQRQKVDFRPHRKSRDQAPKGKRRGRPTSRFVRRLGHHDQVVRWKKPAVRPKWISDSQWEATADWLEIRELRYTLPRKGQRTLVITLATTLLDPVKYPKEKLIELYGMRWQVETHFAELKTTLRMRKIKSQTPEGTRKELAIYCLVYNLIHAIMVEAARRQGATPDRISFIDTIRWLLSAAPGEELPDLLINPSRPGRHQPRVIKDLQDTYRKMSQPRQQMRRRLELVRR